MHVNCADFVYKAMGINSGIVPYQFSDMFVSLGLM